jgi:cyclophilin family peptidyl-prolyl cis-trans isomerase
METNNSGSNVVGAIVVIVAVIVVGYLIWPKSNNITSSITESYSTSTSPIQSTTTTPNVTSDQKINKMHTVTIETNKGTIVFETYDADAPKTVENFITLANKGFYNGVIFHRVISGFMIQGGDPTGTGRGGPGYKFADELDPNTPSAKEGYRRGVVAMANSGPDTNGSQFFIMHADYPLPHNYTIFGKVIKGMEVVDAIANAKKDSADKPLENISMTKVTVANK